MKYVLYAFVALCLFVPTSHTHAYFTTNQSAFAVSDTAALFTIEYKFGHGEYPFYMPLLATRDLPFGSQTDALGFEILKDGKSTKDGTAAGIVLSNATVVDRMYKTAQGLLSSFTLLVVLQTDASDTPGEYSVQVTDLPFYAGNQKDARHLNPSELQYYVTPTVELNGADSSQ